MPLTTRQGKEIDNFRGLRNSPGLKVLGLVVFPYTSVLQKRKVCRSHVCGDRQRIGRLRKNPVFFSWAPRASHDSGDHEHSPGAKWTYCVGGKYRK